MKNAALAVVLATAIAGAAYAQPQATPASPARPSAHTRGVTVLEPTAAPVADTPPATSASDIAPPAKPVAHPAVVHVAPVIKCERAYPTADLRYDDTRAFDTALSARLSAPPHGAGVVVDVAPFEPAAPPYRLRAWFGEIQKSGGDVGRREIECSRGFNLMAMLRQLFTPRPDPVYAPAKKFDAVLWVSKASGKVNQVQFSPR